MVVISSFHLNRLRAVLLACGPFNSDQELQTLFVDPRLRAWRNRLPEASVAAERVDAFLQFIQDKRNSDNDEDGLLLFLQLLSERLDPADSCRQELLDLISLMSPTSNRSPTSNPSPAELNTGVVSGATGSQDQPRDAEKRRLKGQRIELLMEQLKAEYELLHAFEEALRLTDDPRKLARYRRDIERCRSTIREKESELDQLWNLGT